MHRGHRVPRLFLRELICTVSVVAYAAAPATALQIPTSFHAGFYGELTSRPLLDPGAGARSLLSVASVGEIRLDLGVRRPESTDSGGSLVGMLGASFQYNASSLPKRLTNRPGRGATDWPISSRSKLMSDEVSACWNMATASWYCDALA